MSRGERRGFRTTATCQDQTGEREKGEDDYLFSLLPSLGNLARDASPRIGGTAMNAIVANMATKKVPMHVAHFSFGVCAPTSRFVV
jgi:hypothetical protein